MLATGNNCGQDSLLQKFQHFLTDATKPLSHASLMKHIQSHGSHLLRKGRYSQKGGIYFITLTTYQRHPKFTDFKLACSMSRQLHQLPHLAGGKALCWVVMPDHLHLLYQVADLVLCRVMQRLKSRSAIILNRECGSSGRVWSKGYHDHALRRHESLREISSYIINNPIRADLVQHPGDYPFWNAEWI